MAQLDDEQRTLLDRYADATAPSSSEVEHALTRTLARVEASKRAPQLPDARRRFVWFAVAGLATLVIATGAYAGVRWLRARTPPTEPSDAAANFDRAEADAIAIPPTTTGLPRVAPIPEPPEPLDPPELAPDSEPAATTIDAPTRKPRPRARNEIHDERGVEPVEQPPAADASVLAEESRLLAHVRRALHDNDFEGALAWAEEHARRHPHGVLTEERLVLEAVAACRGGQRERGLALAKQLREQFPSTPTLAKVEQACGPG